MVPSCFRPTLHLLPIEQAPPYARSEYILYWYRPKMKPMSGALTLFRLHNETLNIWSHLLGAIWVCAMLMDTCSMPDAAVRNEGQRHATVVYLLTALFCTFSSALYHLFGGILSPRTYRRLFNLDINGISVVIAGSYYPGLLFAFRCNPAAWYFYSCTTASLLVVVSYAVNFDVRDSTRVMTQVLLVVFGLAPSIHWGFITPPEARVRHLSLLVRATPLTRARGRSDTRARRRASCMPQPRARRAQLLMFVCYGAGFAVFFRPRIPERWGRPRLAQYGIGGSHLWWHLCVLAAMRVWYIQCYTSMTDVLPECEPG